MNTGTRYVIVMIVMHSACTWRLKYCNLIGLQSDWTAIFLQQNKSGYRAGTLPSVFREGRVTPD